ncbi:hypothetical protein D9611_014061 [Ephemerocybe angulata]|uniref:Uncharacterized protein n=1 Tax=Ephemerocybe angulata TaxID=980116 RepID=A0A8H5ARR4_9AGAR|nr:hypothetical protein D9611_014061 [Tulosesus angulatus]
MLSRTTILSPTSHGLGSFVRHDTVSVHHGHSLATDMDADHLNAAHHYSTQAIVASSSESSILLANSLQTLALTTPVTPVLRIPENANVVARFASNVKLYPFPGAPKISISSRWRTRIPTFVPVKKSNVHPTEPTLRTPQQYDVPPRTRTLRRHLVESAARGKAIHTYFLIQPPHAL